MPGIRTGYSMKLTYRHQSSEHKKGYALILGVPVLLFGFVFALAAQPVFASAPNLQDDPTVTPTVTETPTITATLQVTATQVNTLPPPFVTGTPTVLVPVTGADLAQPGSGQANMGVWLALWILGLMLIVFGLYSRRQKR
jgi:hypothetical protein